MRKLNFLHHIVTREPDDPVRKMYQQQLLYVAERNWANECREIRERYGIVKDDDEIREMSRDMWKKEVKEMVVKKHLEDLNAEKAKMKKTSEIEPYDSLRCQAYIRCMKPDRARLLFRIRGKITTIKEHRQYEFSNDDMVCRACGIGEETLHHVLCGCGSLCSTVVEEGAELSDELEILETVVDRVKEFVDKVDMMMNVDM